MKIYARSLTAFILLSLVTRFTHAATQTFVQTDYGNDTSQGLKHINDQAIEFLKIENQKHNTHWQSLEPDARIVVYKCLTPMKTSWAKEVPDTIGMHKQIWYVQVSCDSTIAESREAQQWTIYVPTTKPR